MSLKLHKSYSNKFNYKSNYDNYNFKITNSRNQEIKNNDDINKNNINLPNSPRTNKYNKSNYANKYSENKFKKYEN